MTIRHINRCGRYDREIVDAIAQANPDRYPTFYAAAADRLDLGEAPAQSNARLAVCGFSLSALFALMVWATASAQGLPDTHAGTLAGTVIFALWIVLIVGGAAWVNSELDRKGESK